MMVPPLSERPVTEEDEERFREECAPRRYTLRRRWADYRAEAKARRPKGARARAQAWLHVEPFYWTMRVVYVCLAAGAVFAVYINGVAEGWWHAWGEKPSVAATAPTAQPTPAPSLSSEAAMSGGYQIGADGVLVRPAQYAADTYTKPELPTEATENTEKGAEAAAEHYLALLTYAWNTGDTQPFADMSSPTSKFANVYITNISDLYAHGWSFGSSSTVNQILAVQPIATNGADIPENSVLVTFRMTSIDGIKCYGVRTKEDTDEYGFTMSLIMTWSNGEWIETQGKVEADHE
ncbi:MAG: DUF6318 family protein [Actinomyces sp.]|nr:DUF6318 family protein [Actinomyces sp.]